MLLAKRLELSRYIMVLLGIQCLFLVVLALFLPSLLQGFANACWTNACCGIILFSISYYVAFQDFSDEVVSFIVSVSLVLTASLVVHSLSPTSLGSGSHYLQVFSLGVVALYRSRRLMALLVLLSLLEQYFRSLYLPDSLFAASPARTGLILEHIRWLAACGLLYIVCCATGENAPVAQSQAVTLNPFSQDNDRLASKDASAATNDNVVTIDMSSPDSVEALVKVAIDVGARAKKLSRSITNLEGPLKRMVLSINGANRGVQEIKDELSRTAASVIQITQNSEMHANKASQVFRAADEAAYGSQIGAKSTEESIANMDRIREQMDLIAQSMDNLLTKSQKMVQVVGFADELALQSKVLSVNAAIEAAKAGDRGQGFTAVANEVKSLANQSKEATREVRQILKEIQKSISDVRRSISLGNDTVDLASKQCRSTAESIKGLDSSVSSSRVAAEAIMVSSKDQVRGIMQISGAMNDIQIVSEQNSGSLSNLQAEAQKLNVIARELVNDMNSYQNMVDELLSTCAVFYKQDSAG